ncbi:uncharacterized protein DUF2490 [Larkinella arboricola]|uniref:Uncharacterized protein DUF2490 n=1 Tax=Larkinella arboricola TaxID=643671 RepID=A0A327WMY7_LARAB|nr:DUF2490 domain-containing protein [Larkinella arboricola]RAJ92188.1 uncharacterized protein DUF2490 [Larkinella arboricola]
MTSSLNDLYVVRSSSSGLPDKRLLKGFQRFAGFLFFLFLIPDLTQAQQPPWGTWFIGTVQLPARERGWGGFVEGQLRANSLFDEFNYYEVKGGVSYDLGPAFSAMVATGRYHTYNFRDLNDGPQTLETRLWEQITMSQNVDRLKFEHRYRIEQRWFGESTPENITIQGRFRNRVRYRLNMMIPLNNESIKPKTVFVSIYDELFLNYKAPNLERNRVYAGLGYQLDLNWIVQAGWVNQYDQAPVRTGSKNNVVLSVMYRFHRKNGGRDRLPSPMD